MEYQLELTPLQLAIVGLIATALSQGVKLLAAKLGDKKLSGELVTVIVWVVSFLTTAAFLWPQIGPLLTTPGDAAEVAGRLATVAFGVAGASYVVYNLLAQRVLEKFNLNQFRVLSPDAQASVLELEQAKVEKLLAGEK